MDVLPDVPGDGGGGGDGSSGNNSDADDGGPAGLCLSLFLRFYAINIHSHSQEK